MINLDFIILTYLIVGLVLSYLLSFLFLRQYNKEKKIFCCDYYCHIFFFGLAIYHIFIAIFDYSLSFIENSPILEGKMITYFWEFLSKFYFIFSLFSSWIYPYYIAYGYEFGLTNGYYLKLDLTFDYFKRLLHIKWTTIILVLITLPIVLVLLIKQIIKIHEIFDFIALLLNVNNIYQYFHILFYFGFIIANLIQKIIIKSNANEEENYKIWNLGKIYTYYNEEREAIKKQCEKIQTKYNSLKAEKSISTLFEQNFTKFQNNIESLKLDLKLISFNVEDIKKAVIKFKETVLEEFKNDNDAKQSQKKLSQNFFNIEKDEYEFGHKEIEKIKKEEAKKECSFIWCTFCCAKCKKKEVLKNEICDMMTEVNIKALSFKRKKNLISSIKDYFLYNKIDSKCKRNCTVFLLYICLILVLPLLFIESPFFYITNKFKQENQIESTLDFLLILSVVFVINVFYFIIFIYSIIHHQKIQGDLIFGKDGSLSDNYNYIKFIAIIFEFCNAIIYHSMWVLNKQYVIKAKFNELLYTFPIYELDFTINSMDYNISLLDLFPYISFFFVLFSFFLALKFTKLKICGYTIFTYNEIVDFFGDDQYFYGYFFTGCGCFIDIFKKHNSQPLLGQEEENGIL